DDEDDDVDIKEDEEEDEHPTLADSTAVTLPAVDHAPPAEETEPFKTDELLAIPTPPPSPLSPWSSPLPQIPSPPLPISPPPASPTYPLGYRAAMIRLRAETPSTSHSLPPHIILSHTRADTPPSGTPPLLPIPLPTSSPPLHLLATDRRADRHEVTLPPRKRLGIALGLRYDVGESSSAPTARPLGGFPAEYGFVATIDREIMRNLERDVGYGITDTWDEIWDRRAHARTARLMEAEARMQRTTGDRRRLQRCWQRTTGDRHSLLSHNSGTGIRRTERAARECTYTDFLKCQPLNFKGTKGVAGLSQWFERMESVFHISNCTIVGHEAAYSMPWKTLMKMMIDKYYPRNEIKKLEMEIWDLKVKGTDLKSYTQHFQDLALLCERMFPGEADKIEKYVGGLPDMIHGSVVASKPKTMQVAVEITTELMDKKI
ncbi:reverse transcriptase domain-containing protein, partial [Tanacetum coccineum]